MNILVISNNYPSYRHPQNGTFVYELIQKFSELGNNVTVISPQKMEFYRFRMNSEFHEELATVYRPIFFSFSNKKFGAFNTYSLGRFFQVQVIRRIVKKYNIKFDFIYAHFISNGLLAVEALQDYNKPIFVAVGEYRNIDIVKGFYSKQNYNELIKKISGFIAVSPQVKEKVISLGIDSTKIIIEPNGVNLDQFRPLDKNAMRRKFNLPQDMKLVLFIGRFLENKGPLRVLKALNRLPSDVGGIFIGKGPQEICGEKVILKDSLLHKNIPEIMNAADIFVLPTLHEGSSNVIVEAMACGLPVISSDIPEIKFQCNNDFTVLVDPLDVEQIYAEIKSLVFDEERLHNIKNRSLSYSRQFSLTDRARRILQFIIFRTECHVERKI